MSIHLKRINLFHPSCRIDFGVLFVSDDLFAVSNVWRMVRLVALFLLVDCDNAFPNWLANRSSRAYGHHSRDCINPKRPKSIVIRAIFGSGDIQHHCIYSNFDHFGHSKYQFKIENQSRRRCSFPSKHLTQHRFNMNFYSNLFLFIHTVHCWDSNIDWHLHDGDFPIVTNIWHLQTTTDIQFANCSPHLQRLSKNRRIE